MASQQVKKSVQDDEAFPTKQLTILAICRFAEPIAFTSILAYTYVMVQDLNGGDDTNASFYAGLLISAFAVAETMTAMLWGAVSDRYGRKPVVLMGLAGTALSSLMFGLSKKYWVALVARFIGGALNGNVAVMQTMVAEMVKKPEHEPRAYAVQPFVWTLGTIVGSAMGGFLAQPTKFYPGLFREDGLFGEYPYLLPNLIAVAAIVLAIIQGILFLDETNPAVAAKNDQEDDDIAVDETTPLNPNAAKKPSVRERSLIEDLHEVGKNPTFIEDGLPTSSDQNFDIRRSSFGTMYSIKKVPTNQEHDSLGEGNVCEMPEKTFNFAVIMLTLSLVIVSYHQMSFGSILPVYLLDKPEVTGSLDLRGGLGYTVHDVGVYMSVNGVVALFFQGVIFPLFVENIGVWKSFFYLTILYPISYIMMPFLSMLPTEYIPAGIYFVLAVQNFFGIVVVPCALILLKNACPSPMVLGKVNGLAMSGCCAARTVSPPLVGIIYGALGSGAAWWSCTAFAILGAVQLFWIPRDKVDVEQVSVESAFRQKGVSEDPAKAPMTTVDEAIQE